LNIESGDWLPAVPQAPHRDEYGCQVSAERGVRRLLDPIYVERVPRALEQGEGPLLLQLERMIGAELDVLVLRKILSPEPDSPACGEGGGQVWTRAGGWGKHSQRAGGEVSAWEEKTGSWFISSGDARNSHSRNSNESVAESINNVFTLSTSEKISPSASNSTPSTSTVSFSLIRSDSAPTPDSLVIFLQRMGNSKLSCEYQDYP